jgi:hypothetical protein
MLPPSLPPSQPQSPASNPPRRLDSLEQEVKDHWRVHRPKMYRSLQRQGTLDQSVRQAVDQTKDAVVSLVLDSGMPFLEALSLMREEWMYLPEETPDENVEAPESPQAPAPMPTEGTTGLTPPPTL